MDTWPTPTTTPPHRLREAEGIVNYTGTPEGITRNHSRGVSLRQRGEGTLPHRYRDEVTSDGGKRRLRRQVRHAGRQHLNRENAAYLSR
jgi:hypothetical protein